MEREDRRENTAVNKAFESAVTKRNAGFGVDGSGSRVEFLDANGEIAFTLEGGHVRIPPTEKGNGWMELPAVMSSSLNGTHYSVKHSDERQFDTTIGEINIKDADNSASLTGNGLNAPFKVVHHVDDNKKDAGKVYESGAKAEKSGYPSRAATSVELAVISGAASAENADNDNVKKLMLQNYYRGSGR